MYSYVYFSRSVEIRSWIVEAEKGEEGIEYFRMLIRSYLLAHPPAAAATTGAYLLTQCYYYIILPPRNQLL